MSLRHCGGSSTRHPPRPLYARPPTKCNTSVSFGSCVQCRHRCARVRLASLPRYAHCRCRLGGSVVGRDGPEGVQIAPVTDLSHLASISSSSAVRAVARSTNSERAALRPQPDDGRAKRPDGQPNVGLSVARGTVGGRVALMNFATRRHYAATAPASATAVTANSWRTDCMVSDGTKRNGTRSTSSGIRRPCSATVHPARSTVERWMTINSVYFASAHD
jgi:hypothetical protein